MKSGGIVMSDGLVTDECFLVGDRLRVYECHFGDRCGVGDRVGLGNHRGRDDLDGMDWRSDRKRDHRLRDDYRRG